MRFRAKNCMESGGETFYIKKETTAQSSNLESCVTTRTVDISGCGFSRARGFSREKRSRWGSGVERERKRIKIFAKIGGGLRYRVIWLPSFKTEEYRDSIGFAPAVMVCITPWKKRATLFACHLHAICI